VLAEVAVFVVSFDLIGREGVCDLVADLVVNSYSNAVELRSAFHTRMIHSRGSIL